MLEVGLELDLAGTRPNQPSKLPLTSAVPSRRRALYLATSGISHTAVPFMINRPAVEKAHHIGIKFKMDEISTFAWTAGRERETRCLQKTSLKRF